MCFLMPIFFVKSLEVLSVDEARELNSTILQKVNKNVQGIMSFNAVYFGSMINEDLLSDIPS